MYGLMRSEFVNQLTIASIQHRQGWFTYSYCHNSHVRQFHELQHPHKQKPGKYITMALSNHNFLIPLSTRSGEYKPEEDTEAGAVMPVMFISR